MTRRVAVGAVALQLVGQVAACDEHHPAAGLLRRLPYQLPQPVVVLQRQPRQPDAHQPEVLVMLADEVQRDHRAVVEPGVALAPGPGRQAACYGLPLDGLGQLVVVGHVEAHLGRAELRKAALRAAPGGDVKVVRVHCGVGAGDDDGLRPERGDLPRHLLVGPGRRRDLRLAAAAHLRHDHRRVRHHVCSDNRHVNHPFQALCDLFVIIRSLR